MLPDSPEAGEQTQKVDHDCDIPSMSMSKHWMKAGERILGTDLALIAR